MRARKVVTRSGMGARGKFPSFKNGRMLHWESRLEQDSGIAATVIMKSAYAHHRTGIAVPSRERHHAPPFKP